MEYFTQLGYKFTSSRVQFIPLCALRTEFVNVHVGLKKGKCNALLSGRQSAKMNTCTAFLYKKYETDEVKQKCRRKLLLSFERVT